MDDLLTRQNFEKLKKQTKISYVLAGAGLFLAMIFGVLWLTSDSENLDKNIKTASSQINLDSIHYQEQISNFDTQEAVYVKEIDSLGLVLLALEDTIIGLKEEAIAASMPITQDYIAQMIENAKIFSSTDCSKSLAFLYAAKKVASMEKRTGANVDAIRSMIKKCEANVFGESPSASTE